jgi:hypothetical protein
MGQTFVGVLVFTLGVLNKIPFKLTQSAACCKKGFKKQASQQTFGPSYFVRALEKQNKENFVKKIIDS